MIVYYFRNPDSVSEECINGILPNLPQQQQQIVANIKNHRHRCEQVVAYIMLSYAIGHNQAEIESAGTVVKEFPSKLIAPDSEPLLWAFGEHGKPYITNHDGVHFNISHCNNAVAVGVSNLEVGIDVEGRRKFSDSLLQRAFNEEEQAEILSSQEPQDTFAKLWTRKEAWFKWTGTGILIDHLKSTEADAVSSGCNIDTLEVNIANDKSFFLSIAQKQ